MSLPEEGRVEVTILGHTFRAPVNEAREFADKVAHLEREIAELKLCLGREMTRRSRALKSIAEIQAAAGKAALALDGDES